MIQFLALLVLFAWEQKVFVVVDPDTGEAEPYVKIEMNDDQTVIVPAAPKGRKDRPLIFFEQEGDNDGHGYTTFPSEVGQETRPDHRRVPLRR